MTDTTTWTNYWGSEKSSDWDTKTNSFELEEESYDRTSDSQKWAWDANSTANSDTMKSELSGAAKGATIGLAFGGIGAAIGAAVGWLAGLFSGLFGGAKKRAQQQQQYNSYLDQILSEKENLTTEYNRKIQDLQTAREQQLRDLNTTNTRLQDKTNRTIENREAQLELNAKQIEAQSIQNAETLKNANRELIKETSSQTAQLGSSGFRNTGTTTKRIEETQREGEEAIKSQKYQMDVSLYSSNYQMGQNYTDSTYTAYSYQDTIADNITSYSDWLSNLETEAKRLKEDYDRAMEDYDKALQALRESKDFDTASDTLSSILSGLTNFGKGLSGVISQGGSLFSSTADASDYYNIEIV